jgi:hypothetical protein
VSNIVTNLLKALLGNGTVNTFQHGTMGAVFSVDECYSSLLGSTTIEVFWCGPRRVYICRSADKSLAFLIFLFSAQPKNFSWMG